MVDDDTTRSEYWPPATRPRLCDDDAATAPSIVSDDGDVSTLGIFASDERWILRSVALAIEQSPVGQHRRADARSR